MCSPSLRSIHPEGREKERLRSGTSYVVAYEIRDDVVMILAVLHGARRWPETFK
jgi:toxin ParE1/3/4